MYRCGRTFEPTVERMVETDRSVCHHVFREPNPEYSKSVMSGQFRGEVARFCSGLVKEELKNTIRRRRLLKGLPDVRPEYKNPNQSYELDDEEVERKRMRRERNRIAADKCRQKRKEKETTVLLEYKTQESLNDELKQTIKELEEEKKMLSHILQNHPNCKLRP